MRRRLLRLLRSAALMALGLLVWTSFISTSVAAIPSLSAVSPVCGKAGTSFSVKFTGKLDGLQRRVWCDDPAIVFSLPDGAGAAVVSIGPEARPGLHLVVFANAEGASAPLRFAVGPLSRLEEKEPNDETPQRLESLPVWIQGQLDKAGDVDGYAVRLKKGSPLWIKVDAYSLGSAVDMHVQVLDARGVVLATASDGRNLDPEVVFNPPDDGEYVVRLAGFGHPPAADVNLTGGPGKAYLLTLAEGTVVTRIFPAAVPMHGRAMVELRGLKNGSSAEKAEVEGAALPGFGEIGTAFPKGALAPLNVVRTRHPVRVIDVNDAEQATLVMPPLVVAGQLQSPSKPAAYKVAMKKGDKLRARFWSRSLGLGVEGNLVVKGPSGQQVAANENPADVFTEPSVTWSATTDGDYTLVVGDLFQRGGEGCEFVAEIAAPNPEFTVNLLEAKPVRVEVGKTVVIKAKALLSGGWKEPLVVRVNGLPEGVAAAEVPVPEKGGEFDITLQAASNAAPATSVSRVSVWTKASPPVFAEVAFPLRGELRRGHSQSDFAQDLWVSVVPQGTPAPPPDKKK